MVVHYTRKQPSHRICGATGVRLNGVRGALFLLNREAPCVCNSYVASVPEYIVLAVSHSGRQHIKVHQGLLLLTLSYVCLEVC